MTLTTDHATRIALTDGCATSHCLQMSYRLHRQLYPTYSRSAAIMPLTGTFDEWKSGHRTARKRAARARRLGYWFGTVDRADRAGDVYRINRSTPERQGRPMGAGYLERPVYGDNPVVCQKHHVYTYGVFSERRRLVAYLWLYRCGDLAMVSSILGHADLLDDGIMYLLYEEALEDQWPLGGTVFYNLWHSGTEGLRWFKTRLGLGEGDVEWAL